MRHSRLQGNWIAVAIGKEQRVPVGRMQVAYRSEGRREGRRLRDGTSTASERTVEMKERKAKNRRTMLFCLWAGWAHLEKGAGGFDWSMGWARMPIMEDGAGFGVGAQCPVPEGVSQLPGGVGGGSADDDKISR